MPFGGFRSFEFGANLIIIMGSCGEMWLRVESHGSELKSRGSEFKSRGSEFKCRGFELKSRGIRLGAIRSI